MAWKGDPNAIHTVVDGEIAGLTEKGTPVNADLVVIEDSADSNAKKKAQLGNLPGGGGGGGGASRTLLDSATLASDQSSISSSGITNAHRDLELVIWGRTDASVQGDAFLLRVGNTSVDTGSNYSWIFREQGDTSTLNRAEDDNEIGPNTGVGTPFTAANADAGHFGFVIIRILFYADTAFHRRFHFEGHRRSSSGNQRRLIGEASWGNSADEIDIIEVRPAQGSNLVSGSAWKLYGVD